MPIQRGSVSLLVVGAGDRGNVYADYARMHPDAGHVVAVAEPNSTARAAFAERHALPPARCFSDWTEALAAGRHADAVVIATPDRLHASPAVAFADAGWNTLLEKPLAPTPRECSQVVAAAKRNGIVFAVCHVLRYTKYTAVLKQLISEGRIGDVVGAQRLEPVGWWHFAHAYVRGNWSREADSSPVLLAKCCHDLDWLRYVFGVPCERIASFASLRHFRREQMPAGAAPRCLDCNREPGCAYSAVRLYLGDLGDPGDAWPARVVARPPVPARLREALRTGPYGRCVYACDNDVPDQQVVIMEFAGGRTATFTMSAFTPPMQRQTVIFGTHGWLVGNGSRIELCDFGTDRQETYEVAGNGARHGGGDDALMETFLRAVAEGDPSLLLSGPDESLSSHLMVFAAERARHEGRVVNLLEEAT